MPLLNIDTGHHFPELNEFRDRRAAELGCKLIIRTVESAIANGTAVPAPGEVSRNRLQIPTLLAAIEEFRFDCCIGGARRDEEKARAKERFFSFRDGFGQWDPKNQRPEIWNLYNARLNPGENMRVFPLSNWTEMDVWEYIRKESLEVPGIYFSHPAQMRPPPGPMAAGERPRAAQSRASRSRTSSCASAPLATSSAPAASSRPPRPSTTSSPRSPPPASPNAAPAPTTRPPKPPWKTASGRGISSAMTSAVHKRLRSRTVPSPHPSPLPWEREQRGPQLEYPTAPDSSPDWRRFSLSPRERAGVRGTGCSTNRHRRYSPTFIFL